VFFSLLFIPFFFSFLLSYSLGLRLCLMQVIDYDIDAYAERLEQILQRKHELNAALRQKIAVFRKQLQREERLSKKVAQSSHY